MFLLERKYIVCQFDLIHFGWSQASMVEMVWVLQQGTAMACTLFVLAGWWYLFYPPNSEWQPYDRLGGHVILIRGSIMSGTSLCQDVIIWVYDTSGHHLGLWHFWSLSGFMTLLVIRLSLTIILKPCGDIVTAQLNLNWSWCLTLKWVGSHHPTTTTTRNF